VTDTRTDIDRRVDSERGRLIEVLEGLDDQQWRTPSLCSGWSVRDLVVHLLMPYELSAPRLLVLMLRARFDFDRMADRWATADRRTPAEVIAALRATAHQTFSAGPGAPAEAPLSHLVIHAQDVYRPLGVPSPSDPENVRIALDQLTGPRFLATVPAGRLDGVRLRATDTDWHHGDGADASGPATALLTVLAGRSAALQDLTGPGADLLRRRMPPAD